MVLVSSVRVPLRVVRMRVAASAEVVCRVIQKMVLRAVLKMVFKVV